MFLIFGKKGFSQKRVGYASDFCESCKQPALITKWRWFSWGHVFWIPLIPLGYKHAWTCGLCGQDADGQPRTSATAKVTGALLMGLGAFVAYADGGEGSTATSEPLVAAVCLAIALGFIAWIFFPRPKPSAEKLSAVIPPVDTNYCAACGGSLATEPRLRCVSCELDVIDRSADAK